MTKAPSTNRWRTPVEGRVDLRVGRLVGDPGGVEDDQVCVKAGPGPALGPHRLSARLSVPGREAVRTGGWRPIMASLLLARASVLARNSQPTEDASRLPG